MGEEWGAAYPVSIDKPHTSVMVGPHILTAGLFGNNERTKVGIGVFQFLPHHQHVCRAVNPKGVEVYHGSVL